MYFTYNCGGKVELGHPQRDLSNRANRVLSGYGGVEGLAQKPAWIICEVLNAFFTEEERKEILKLRPFKEPQKEILRIFRGKVGRVE